MADPAGPRGTDPGSGAAPAPPWVTQPMPDGPPQIPEPDPATAPTEPEIPRPDAGWAGLDPASTTPGFADGSGFPAPGAPPASPFAAPAYADPSDPAAYGSSGYAPQAYPPQPHGYPAYGPTPYGPYAYGAYAPPQNSGLAVASMVCGIIGLVFCQIFCVPALIMGFVARRQIRDSQGTQTGDAFAIAGIVLGGLAALFLVLVILFYAGMFAFAFSGV